jgi:hypothetical protein
MLGLGLLGAFVLWGAWTIYQRWQAPAGQQAGTEPCPPLTPEYRRCPWTPEQYTISSPCTEGFCFDGGPQGTLACKQENTDVPNARLTDLRDVVCNDGFPNAVRDRCTNVLLRCDP